MPKIKGMILLSEEIKRPTRRFMKRMLYFLVHSNNSYWLKFSPHLQRTSKHENSKGKRH